MREMKLKIANQFGTVDVREELSKSYVHIEGQRLQPICRKLKVKYAIALVGFEERGTNAKFGYSPQLNGVVVSSKSASKLIAAIEERDARAAARPIITEEVKRARRERKQQQDIQQFLMAILKYYPKIPIKDAEAIAKHTCVVGSGRVGRSGVVGIYSAVELAVRAHVRHNHTEYESILNDTSEGYMTYEERQEARSDAREQVVDKMNEIIERWSATENQA